ncbi:MAG: hypothetical protein D6732_19655 [Methanobacteriota archaeon]|nr:MAG: hypothetical protein D6732_19655 [Euryarchaeota archaeon]
MCRLLSGKFPYPIQINSILEQFAEDCRSSKEFQGHGWGITYLTNGQWITRKSIQPIWESLPEEPIYTSSFLVHARSAFRDAGIVIENNMPFENDRFVFAFNGELRKVRLNLPGSTGAKKIFNFFLRKQEPSILLRWSKVAAILKRRSEYIRAMNVILIDKETNLHYAYSHYNEDPEYFRLHRMASGGFELISSFPIDRRLFINLRGEERPRIVYNAVLANQGIEVI